jgi:hypothetical protein
VRGDGIKKKEMEEKTEPKKPKARKIQPYTKDWQNMANNLARSWVTIKPCRDCGYPVIDGYCCQTCGSVEP